MIYVASEQLLLKLKCEILLVYPILTVPFVSHILSIRVK